MASYLKGIGDALTRTNEILPSLDARIYYFLCGHTLGIIKGEFNEFSANTIDRGIIVKSGMMQAHGYFACSDTDTQFNFVMPSTTNYVHLYAEIDLSVVPNRFEIKATTMSNNSTYIFRQDNLRSTTNGKFQFHLWQVTLTATTITLTDKRTYITKPLSTITAEDYTSAGGIADKFTDLANSKLPKMTLVLSNVSITITTGNAGATNFTTNTIIDDGNILIANFQITNYGAVKNFSSTMFIYGSNETWATIAYGSYGIPYSTVENWGCSLKRVNDNTITFGGSPRVSVRSDQSAFNINEAKYTLVSLYKVNL